MIKLLQSGGYKLLETKDNITVLHLDNKNAYVWKNVETKGDLQYIKFNPEKICCFLALGNYRLYEVKDETNLTSGNHFELYVGKSKWQGYILPNGLPHTITAKKPIKQTPEIITKARRSTKAANY